MKQSKIVKARLEKQKNLVVGSILRKLKSLKTPQEKKELTNKEVEVMLYQYSTSEIRNDYDEKTLEWIHERMTHLNDEQMSILRKRYWEAKSLTVIANEFGKFDDHKWASRKLQEVLEVLRARP